jgi:hypothetical protein
MVWRGWFFSAFWDRTWAEKDGKGSSGARKKGIVEGVGQEQLGPSYFFISLVLGPLMVRTFLKVYMELGSYFFILQ